MSDAAFARSLKVTDEQITRLKDVPAVTAMALTDADQAVVKSAFGAAISFNATLQFRAIMNR